MAPGLLDQPLGGGLRREPDQLELVRPGEDVEGLEADGAGRAEDQEAAGDRPKPATNATAAGGVALKGMRRLPRPAALAALVALAAVLLLAACGGSGSSAKKTTTTAPAPTGLTKAEYIAQADAICANGKRRAALGKIQSLAFQSPIPTAEIVRRLHTAAAAFVQVRDRLTALAPPAADRAALTHWTTQIASFSGMVSTAPDKVAHGNALIELAKLAGNLAVADIEPLTFAKNYGMRACSTLGP